MAPVIPTVEYCEVAYNTILHTLCNREGDHAGVGAAAAARAAALEKVPDIVVDGIFVTLETVNPEFGSEKYNLRGCIGNLSRIDLRDGLVQYALAAAFEDPRFPPITHSELKKYPISVKVAVLHSFELCKDPYDWSVGKNGLILTCMGRQSTFLPEVAKEQGWSKDETLYHLLLKAGISANRANLPELLARSSVRKYESDRAKKVFETK